MFILNRSSVMYKQVERRGVKNFRKLGNSIRDLEFCEKGECMMLDVKAS